MREERLGAFRDVHPDGVQALGATFAVTVRASLERGDAPLEVEWRDGRSAGSRV